MKKIISQILIVCMFFFGIGGALAVPKVANAACSLGDVVVGNGIVDCVFEASVAIVMPLISKFLQLSAYMFDYAITLNMNIAQFLQKPGCTTEECQTSPVEVLWRLIRDISGMFFIFILIWASIKMIIGGENSKGVIVSVILAGLLVNFSLFATKVVIDASNSLTLTVYNAISPGQKDVGLFDSTLGGTFLSSNPNNLTGKEGTISSKIMQVVQLQSLFAATSEASKNKTNFNVTGIVTVIGGASLMLVLGLALLAAGVMFLWRFIMLLVLMAFSPIPALAYAFPSLQKWSKRFVENLINQCVFAPLFLFFIYIALKILTNDGFLYLTRTENSSFATIFGGTNSSVAPLIQYGLAIAAIFGGLLAAKSFGAKGAQWGMDNITGLGKWTSGVVGRNTVGVAARDLGKVFDKMSAMQISDKKAPAFISGASREFTKLTRSSLKSVANNKFGSKQSLDDIKKENKEYDKKQRELQFVAALKRELGREKVVPTAVAAALDKMSDSEIASLDKDVLTNSHVIRHLSRGVYTQVDKSDKTDAQKTAIFEARKKELSARVKDADLAKPDTMKALKGVIDTFDKDEYAKAAEKAISDEISGGSPRSDIIKRLMKKLDGEDIIEMDPATITHPEFAKHLSSSQLKKMEYLDRTHRTAIGGIIISDVANVGFPFVRKNRATWS